MEQALNQSTLVIEAGKTEHQYWKDLWRYRELFYFLAWRDVLIRYKQTAIGVAWSVIRPLLTMVVLTVVFSRIAHLNSYGVPYPILVFSGMLPWQYFSNALAESSGSLIENSNMVAKIYFPRIVVPISAAIASLADFAITLVLLIIMMAIYKYPPSGHIFFLPAFAILAVAAAVGPGVWMSALNVKYRDFRYIVPFIVQFGLYISPVGWSSHLAPSGWKALYSLNPMVCVIDGFRWCILGDKFTPDLTSFWISFSMIVVLFWWGIVYFRKTERTFADHI